MTKKTVLLFTLALMLAVGTGAPAFARHGNDDNQTTTSNVDDSEENEVENENEVEDEDGFDDSDSREDRMNKMNARIAERRAELEQKFEAKKERIKERLAGKRLELCENREERINSLIQSSAEHAKRKLAVFQKIEQGVKNFYEDKGLSADGYEAAVANADEKEAEAIAAIDAMVGLTFSCDSVDGSNPGSVIRQAAHARHDALQSYKEAVRELILEVKQALEATETETEG